MSFVVEDGKGLENANAYISVVDCDTYQAEFARTAWALLTNDNKQLYIKQATKYIDNKYNFKGQKISRAQALSWPRSDCYDKDGFLIDSDIVPKEIEKAVCEIAYLYSQGTDFYSQERLTKKEKVGSLEVEYIDQGDINNYLEIDEILKGIVDNGLNNRLSRV
jgi:hypothetical protein